MKSSTFAKCRHDCSQLSYLFEYIKQSIFFKMHYKACAESYNLTSWQVIDIFNDMGFKLSPCRTPNLTGNEEVKISLAVLI